VLITRTGISVAVVLIVVQIQIGIVELIEFASETAVGQNQIPAFRTGAFIAVDFVAAAQECDVRTQILSSNVFCVSIAGFTVIFDNSSADPAHNSPTAVGVDMVQQTSDSVS